MYAEAYIAYRLQKLWNKVMTKIQFKIKTKISLGLKNDYNGSDYLKL